uniref:Uncharacterized protein n=1 Tax=Anguilla anguilla TaxID=7936 RepID=A0A0E9UQS8_ANGAN
MFKRKEIEEIQCEVRKRCAFSKNPLHQEEPGSRQQNP